MEEVLKESAKQVPALVIVVVMCVMFARLGGTVIKNFLAQQSEARSEYIGAIQRFHADNLTARVENRQTIQENSVATGKQTAALNELTSEVKELRGNLSTALRKFGT